MPMVLHELNNATQYLGMLHSVHTQDPSSGILERSAGDLGATASSVEDLGLLMAILSTTAGTDLLLERRSDRGCAIALSMTIRALRKKGVDVTLPDRLEVTGLADAAQGWELPWAVCGSLWAALDQVSDGATLRLNFDDRGWGADIGGGESMRAHLELVMSVMPEVTGQVSGEAWSLRIPEAWITTGH